jgi:hypothetical protein
MYDKNRPEIIVYLIIYLGVFVMEKHVRLKEHFQKYLSQPTKETL